MSRFVLSFSMYGQIGASFEHMGEFMQVLWCGSGAVVYNCKTILGTKKMGIY